MLECYFGNTILPPKPPGGFDATASTNSSVTLAWTSANGAAHYQIQYRKSSADDWVTWDNNPTGTTVAITSLDKGTGYKFRACAYGNGNTHKAACSDWTSTVSKSTTKPPKPPNDPPPPSRPNPEYTVTINSSSGSEVDEGSDVTFTVSASSAASSVLIVNVSVTEDGSFIRGTPLTTVTISRGSSSATLTVSTEDDDIDESDGAVTAAIQSNVQYTVGSPSSASVSVRDNDDPLPKLPALGYQSDFTVQYRIGVMPTRDTSLPKSDDPAVVIPNSIDTAVITWNQAVATPTSNWHGVLFCVRRTTADPAPDNACPIKRTPDDGYTTVIDVVGSDAACSRAACVDWEIENQHMKDMTMKIAQPAAIPSWSALRKKYGFMLDKVNIIWTNNHKRHEEVEDVKKFELVMYMYLPGVVMHEFGHTAGLDDLHEHGDDYGEYLMNIRPGYYNAIFAEMLAAGIPKPDIAYLKQVYDNAPGSTSNNHGALAEQ